MLKAQAPGWYHKLKQLTSGSDLAAIKTQGPGRSWWLLVIQKIEIIGFSTTTSYDSLEIRVNHCLSNVDGFSQISIKEHWKIDFVR